MKSIKLSDYYYHLPQDKIATHGIAQRDQSKLLVSKNNSISATTFSHLSEQLPSESTLFFNNTKVIQARLFLKRLTGAIIEVFLLTPADKNLSIQDTLPMTSSVTFNCMIGNLKKWQSEEVLTQTIQLKNSLINLQVRLINREEKTVEFSWDSDNITFGAIIEAIGHTPLPPYIKRKDEDEDALRYQTIYSKLPGAVAAPTAGLHFTKEVLASLAKKGIKTQEVTLHVSAGTFQPIKEELVADHPMHSEQIIVTREAIRSIIHSKYTVAVGTTAMRTLESLYWYGVQLLINGKTEFLIDKLAPYKYKERDLPPVNEAFHAIAKHMDNNDLGVISGNTEIFIMPGYSFKVCCGLITNFHQPGSTLILLVAAFLGESWRKVYDFALNNDFKFLSYGDSSVFLT